MEWSWWYLALAIYILGAMACVPGQVSFYRDTIKSQPWLAGFQRRWMMYVSTLCCLFWFVLIPYVYLKKG